MSNAQSVGDPTTLIETSILLLFCMKKRWQPKFWLFSVLMFVVSVPTYASQAATVTIIGHLDCKTWMTDRRKATSGLDIERLADAGDVAWINGFMTGLNYAYTSDEGTDMLRAIDADTISDWVDRYCQQHPRKSTVDAALKLFIELQKIKK